MSWQLHRAERADTLVQALAAVLAQPLPDPFATDVVAVPARGVERWLRQRLSHWLGASSSAAAEGQATTSDGVCAGIDMPSPARLFADLLAQVDGMPADADPWRAESLPWRVLELLEAESDAAWARPLVQHLRASAHLTSDSEAGAHVPGGHRLSLARRLSRLLSGYAADRPALVRDWLAGGMGDGRPAAGELRPEHQWQPELLRQLAGRLAVAHPVLRRDAGLASVRDDPGVIDLPSRVSIFGATRLSAADLEVLAALAVHRHVHVWLPHPSPVSWQRMAVSEVATSGDRRSDRSVAVVANPLLRSLGRDSRELQLRLSAVTGAAVGGGHVPAAADEPPRQSALAVLQNALRDDAPRPPSNSRVVLAADDRSVRVLSCHGRARQVEVLREVLTGLLADDPTLQPRDLLVMCPDIETFAPMVLATFGCDADGTRDAASEDDPALVHPGQRLRVRLADRSLRQSNPLLDVVANLVALANARVTSAELLDLAAGEAVRQRFDLDDDDLAQVREWVQHSNIRWGLRASGRQPYDLGDLPDNTWHRGIDQWLLGVAVDSQTHDIDLGGLPLDDVDSSDVDLVGRFVEFVHRVAAVLRRLAGPAPLSEWIGALQLGLDTLTATEPSSSWQRVQADRVLAEMLHSCGNDELLLEWADVSDLLAEAVAGRPTRSSFRTGDLTVCSMVPMRSVPHRVVALLGVDDGDLPRVVGVDGDDVLAVDPQLGERDVASEDRHLLLDAVLAASEHLVVLYSGADERTGARRPPAVPLGELLDDLDARAVCATGARARSHIVTDLPLQPFDPRNFGLDDDVPRSFDQVALEGAMAARGVRRPPGPFLTRALPAPAASDTIELEELVRFFAHPVRYFLRQRLGLSLRDHTDDLETELSVELDGLQRWQIGDRMLAARVAGAGVEEVQVREHRRGSLPPGPLGLQVLGEISTTVEAILALAPAPHEPPSTHDVEFGLPDGRTVRGSVAGVRGHTLTTVQYSTVRTAHRLGAWVRLLAWRATTAPDDATAVIVGGARPPQLHELHGSRRRSRRPTAH